jgi:hypothetical protein
MVQSISHYVKLCDSWRMKLDVTIVHTQLTVTDYLVIEAQDAAKHKIQL